MLEMNVVTSSSSDLCDTAAAWAEGIAWAEDIAKFGKEKSWNDRLSTPRGRAVLVDFDLASEGAIAIAVCWCRCVCAAPI